MIRAILWKEWHEHRAKYIAYWLTINAPVLLLVLAIGLTKGARIPFVDLSDAMTMKYLPLALTEALAVMSVFLLATGYLAVSTFSQEIENRSLFFVYERGVSRRRYFAIKLLNGACHVALATACAVLLLPLASYAMMLMSGKVTLAGSSSAFALVMSTAARAAVWSALVSLGAFTACTMLAVLVPRWWLAAGCSFILTAAFVGYASDYVNLLPDMPNDSMSIGFGLSASNGWITGGQWVTISRAFKPEELNAIARFLPLPLLTTVVLIVAFCFGTAWLYERKELV